MSAPDPELEPDERLRAALRHAPDADLGAPPLLGARIVAAAHQALQSEARPAGRAQRWGSAFGWRMGGAGSAFAALLVATVLWVGRDEYAGSTAPESAAPAATPARELTVQPGDGGSTQNAQNTQNAQMADAAKRAAPPRAVAAPAAPAPAAPMSQRRETVEAETLGERAAPAARRAQESLGAARSSAAPTTAPAAMSDAAAPATLQSPTPRAGTSAPAPVSLAGSWLAAAAVGGEAIRWQSETAVASGGELPAGWLQSLDAATRGGWIPAASPAASGNATRLLRAGVPIGRIVFGAGELWLCDMTAACQRAAVEPQVLRQLQDGLRR